MPNRLTYLASPYSPPPKLAASMTPVQRDSWLEARYWATVDAAAWLLRRRPGLALFCPILMSHEIGKRLDWPNERWYTFDRPFEEACDALIVLKLPYWDESVGVAGEIERFAARGIEPDFVDWPPLEVA